MMKRLYLAAGLLSVFLLIFLNIPSARHRGGRLVLERDSMQWQGRTPSAEGDQAANRPSIELVNDGETPVCITSIKTSCGCASAWVEPSCIPPGVARGS